MTFSERLQQVSEILISLTGAPIPSQQFQILADFVPVVAPCNYLAVCLVDPDVDGYRVHSLFGAVSQDVLLISRF